MVYVTTLGTLGLVLGTAGTWLLWLYLKSVGAAVIAEDVAADAAGTVCLAGAVVGAFAGVLSCGPHLLAGGAMDRPPRWWLPEAGGLVALHAVALAAAGLFTGVIAPREGQEWGFCVAAYFIPLLMGSVAVALVRLMVRAGRQRVSA